MTAQKLEPTDIEPVLAAHTGNNNFETALKGVSSDTEFIRVLARYIQFNSVFGGGVANLAGEIAVRQDLFRDKSEPVVMLADRSVEVASDIFFAAVDEFDDRATRYRDTHRTLAQATLKGVGRFYDCEGTALNALLQDNVGTTNAIQKVSEGYGISLDMDAHRIFRGIGFHAGSEILADREFGILDEYMRTNRPQLVVNLEQSYVEIGGEKHNCYYWVKVHTSVEADHFAFAAKGANRALEFYTGPESGEQLKAWLLEGFGGFADVQAEFMASLRGTA